MKDCTNCSTKELRDALLLTDNSQFQQMTDEQLNIAKTKYEENLRISLNLHTAYAPEIRTKAKIKLRDINQELESRVKKRGQKIYLAGPISSNPDYKQQFAKAKKMLENNGYAVISPVAVEENLPKEALSRADLMQLGLALLKICNEIAVLPNHENSRGCQMELAYAKAIGMPICYLTEKDLTSSA